MSTLNPLLAVDLSERRRSQRFHHVMPLVIRGEFAKNRRFWEDTYTISISAHGALLILSTEVELGQSLVLMNPQSWDERDVRVARVGPSDGKMAHVAVEFAEAAPEFWPVGAPPRRASGSR